VRICLVWEYGGIEAVLERVETIFRSFRTVKARSARLDRGDRGGARQLLRVTAEG
jgi:hypothetical protein